tara:strand:+ start:348 stop:623 length:276 start_codon:yes stop_codon:yes gene_type:complete
MQFPSKTINGIALGAISAIFTLDSVIDAISGKPIDSVLSGSVAALSGNAARSEFEAAVKTVDDKAVDEVVPEQAKPEPAQASASEEPEPLT